VCLLSTLGWTGEMNRKPRPLGAVYPLTLRYRFIMTELVVGIRHCRAAATTEDLARKVEAVPGLSNARKRMEELAAAVPGRYFVFDTHSH
jgi:hypothetical protein